MRLVFSTKSIIHSAVSVVLLLVFVLLAPPALASTTDGTIDTTNRYVWTENTGWLDFGTSEGNVHVTDSALSGYAWGENIGWISLNCSNTDSCATVDYKVTNNSEGTLGGYAWSENVGWIDFDPANGGVTINSSGVFSGYAWGELVGWIVFNCSNEDSCATVDYTVTTDWRPASSRTAASTTDEPTTQETTQTSGGSRGGHDSPAMQSRIAAAQQRLLALYDGSLRRTVAQEPYQEVPQEPEPDAFASDEQRRLYRAAQKLKSQPIAQNFENIAERRGRLFAMVGDDPVLYSDVLIDAWYAPYVASLIQEGVATGYADETGKPKGEFGVANPVTVAEVLKMALEAAGKDIKGLAPPRNASAKGMWASAYVAKAEALNLAVVTPDRNVNSSATRGEVVQIVMQTMEILTRVDETLVQNLYTDLPVKYPYRTAILSATIQGLITGDTDADGNRLGSFRPSDPINRAEVAKIIALIKEAYR